LRAGYFQNLKNAEKNLSINLYIRIKKTDKYFLEQEGMVVLIEKKIHLCYEFQGSLTKM
jgi:hypothetical protein